MIPVFLFSLSIHEFAHAYASNRAGDMYATYLGRLTLNPIAHIDLFGTILFPAMLLISTGGQFFFGWAKPVPVNPLRFKKAYWEVIVSGAGPASNFLVATVFWLLLFILIKTELISGFNQDKIREIILGINQDKTLGLLFFIPFYFILTNLVLGLFNLLPIPPLDGSHILFYFLWHKEWGKPICEFLSRFGFILILIIILPGTGDFFDRIIAKIFNLVFTPIFG